MRLMYHEQVRSFIKKTRGVPLSTETLEICFSYLAFKYVSPATKTLILKEMHIRLQLHEHAGLISNSFVLHRGIVGQLLHSSNPRVREHISAVLKALAVSSSASWSLDVWMSLASDVDIEVREAARYAVDQITEGLAGKQAAANPEAWEDCYALLGNTDSRTRRFACDVLGNLAAHESPPSTFLGLQPCLRFVSFLRDDDFEVQRCAVYALARLSNWSRGAEAVVVAGTLEHVPRLLKSYDNETRRWTCEMLGDIAFHASSPIIQLGVDICAGIVSRLCEENKRVKKSALRALWKISRSYHGAYAIVDTTVLEHVPNLLEVDEFRLLTYETLTNLALRRVLSVPGSILRTRAELLLSDDSVGNGSP